MSMRPLRWLAATLLVGGCFELGYGYAAHAEETPLKIVQVSSHRFVFVPDHITLKRGEAVEFELSSDDVPMGFSLPDFSVRADIVPGRSTRLRLTPQKTGSYTFLCDVFCGSGHENMDGVLTVVD